MSTPTLNNVQQVSPVLTNLLVGYQQADNRFVAGKLMPSVPVDKDNGTYYIFDQTYWLSDDMKNRAPGGAYPRSGFKLSTDTFKTLQWALAFDLPDEVAANNQTPMSLETAGLRYLAQKSLIRKERAFATDFMTTSVWGTDKTVSSKWSDYSASDPITDIRDGKRTISQNTGMAANVLVMGEIVLDRLVNHPDIIDRIKYTQAATQQGIESVLASLLGVEKILVGSAIYETAAEGATSSKSAIIDDDALLMYVDMSATTMFVPTALKMFTWAPGGGAGSIIRPYYDNDRDSMVMKTKEQWDMKVVASACGYFFSDVVD